MPRVNGCPPPSLQGLCRYHGATSHTPGTWGLEEGVCSPGGTMNPHKGLWKPTPQVQGAATGEGTGLRNKGVQWMGEVREAFLEEGE